MDPLPYIKFKDSLQSEPLRKSWSMRFGDDLIPFFGAGGAFYVTHYFRKQLKIRPFAPWTCYMPVLGISGIAIDVLNTSFTNHSILTGDDCPPCIYIKAGLLQAVMGIGYPLIFAPVVTFYTADKLVTYPVPSLSRAPKEVMNLALKMIQMNTRRFLIAGGIQFAGAFFLAWHKHDFLLKFIETK